MVRMVEEFGFLPLLKNRIPGYSVEEHTPANLWFVSGVDGPWEWKGPVIQKTGCAYGKFFHGKAGFIGAEWFPDFANYRRDGYDFDARYEDGLARYQDKIVYDILAERPSLLSKEWRNLVGIQNRGEFDAIVSRLQMLGYVTTIDFEYPIDKNGNPYGWGLARYAVPEKVWSGQFEKQVYLRTPEESRMKIALHIKKLFPDLPEKELNRFIG